MLDFKEVTLELYNQEVKVIFMPETECSKKYGPTLEGILVGRIWGERFDDDSNVSTVIGIIIKKADEDFNISCSEIESIERLVKA